MSNAAEIADTAPARQRPLAVFLSRFPSVTETFILREVTEIERQAQPVRLVPMLRESPPVIHDAAKAWTRRALYTPYIDREIARANLRALLHRPLLYISLLLRLAAGTILRPGTLLRTLAIFPKSVRLAEQLQREGIRHIHAHFATHPTTMALIVSRFAPISFSFTVHAHDIQVDRSLLRWKIAEARFIRSISDFNRRFLESLYDEARGKIEVIHVGIEPEVYEANARRRSSQIDQPPRILCVAAHKPYKGLPVLIDACALLRNGGVVFHCEVVGHGPMHDELEARIRTRGLEGLVTLTGPRGEEEVARKMSEAALFVLPSIIASDGQMEGIPVALMEAMASGKAVISTAISGIPELIDSGVNGVLVSPGDAEALAAAMRDLLGDRRRADELGRRAQEKVRNAFSLRGCVAQLLARL
ncbi:MAG TPA: glycosyltransferase family 4 protein, partial [Thermoanaerobaculia bacterium]|nr:glycosyltransferase family 4 protein [Thermoanaerobaculia bacterium]